MSSMPEDGSQELPSGGNPVAELFAVAAGGSPFLPLNTTATPPDPRFNPTVLFPLSGSFAETIVEAAALGVNSEAYQRLSAFVTDQLGTLSPFAEATHQAEGSRGIAWYFTICGDEGTPSKPADISPDWVRRRLEGATLERGWPATTEEHGADPGDVVGLLTEGRLPLTAGGHEQAHADILPVVVLTEYDGPPIEAKSNDPHHPYFLAISLPAVERALSANALAFAKAFGKVLGLADEGTDASQLSPPDRWGRPFPNVWFSHDADSEGSPWAHIHDGVEPGGLGLGGGGIYRPTADCLMSKPLGSVGDFCAVCRAHLEPLVLSAPTAWFAVPPAPPLPLLPESQALGPLRVEAPWPDEVPHLVFRRMTLAVTRLGDDALADEDVPLAHLPNRSITDGSEGAVRQCFAAAADAEQAVLVEIFVETMLTAAGRSLKISALLYPAEGEHLSLEVAIDGLGGGRSRRADAGPARYDGLRRDHVRPRARSEDRAVSRLQVT